MMKVQFRDRPERNDIRICLPGILLLRRDTVRRLIRIGVLETRSYAHSLP